MQAEPLGNSPRTLFGISVYWLSLSVLTDGLTTLVLPADLQRHAGDARATALGVLTFVGLAAAMAVQPLAGAWSDRRRTRGGRRATIGTGLLLTLPAMALYAVGGLPALAVGYVLVLCAASVSQAGQQGFIPDLVPPGRRGLAAGLKGFMDLAGAAVGFVLLGGAVGSGGSRGGLLVIAAVLVGGYLLTVVLAELATTAGRSVDEVGAMAVGRHEDGTPAVPTPTPPPDGDANDFHFGQQDPDGTSCPRHAHIRKTNPRGDIGADVPERSRRVVRRGITYGLRPDLAAGSTAPSPATGVGLLFLCFQGNLDQFAIQQEGSDSNDFVRVGDGPDAVIGQNADPVAQHWPSGGTVTFTMANFVTMLGGEYLFAPSMTFLLNGLDESEAS